MINVVMKGLFVSVCGPVLTGEVSRVRTGYWAQWPVKLHSINSLIRKLKFPILTNKLQIGKPYITTSPQAIFKCITCLSIFYQSTTQMKCVIISIFMILYFIFKLLGN